MNKVKLPKEVAEAVQTKFDHYNQDGMAYMMLECSSIDDVIRKWIDSEKENIVILSQALVELYKTVQTPKDKVREYYEDLKRESLNETEGVVTYSDQIYALTKTLNLLNITIEGVNT